MKMLTLNKFSKFIRYPLVTVGLGLAVFGWTADSLAAPYQRYEYVRACKVDLCELNFPVVPAGKRLDVTNISCYIKMENEGDNEKGSLDYLQLIVRDSANAIVTASTLVPHQIGEEARIDTRIEKTTYAANHEVSVFANAGQHFQFQAKPEAGMFLNQAQTASVFACHISGQLRP